LDAASVLPLDHNHCFVNEPNRMIVELFITGFSSILSSIILVDIRMNDEIMTLKAVGEYLKLAEKTKRTKMQTKFMNLK